MSITSCLFLYPARTDLFKLDAPIGKITPVTRTMMLLKNERKLACSDRPLGQSREQVQQRLSAATVARETKAAMKRKRVAQLSGAAATVGAMVSITDDSLGVPPTKRRPFKVSSQ